MTRLVRKYGWGNSLDQFKSYSSFGGFSPGSNYGNGSVYSGMSFDPQKFSSTSLNLKIKPISLSPNTYSFGQGALDNSLATGQSAGGSGGVTNPKKKVKQSSVNWGNMASSALSAGANVASSFIPGPKKDEFGLTEYKAGDISNYSNAVASALQEKGWLGKAIALVGNVAGVAFGDKTNERKYQSQRNAAMIGQRRNQYAMAKEGQKLKVQSFFNKLDKKDKVIPRFKAGGMLVEEKKDHIIPKGKLHKENNNIGNKDKGIPIVAEDGTKLYELEKEELVLSLPVTEELEGLVGEYNKTNDDGILVHIGERLTDELLTNTEDKSEKFKKELENEG